MDGDGRDGLRGNLPGPHGGVHGRDAQGCGGNPDGLREPPGAVGGRPLDAQPAPDLPRPEILEPNDPRDGQEGLPLPGGDPLGVWYPRHRTPADGGVGKVAPGLTGGAELPVAPKAAMASSTTAGPIYSDPLGALVQGIAQLQSAMSESLTSRTKEVEIVKPGLSELPKLADLGQNSAIDVGDWLHGLQNHMGDLSSNSGQWWAEVLSCLSQYYGAYLAASHVGKLTLKAEDYEST